METKLKRTSIEITVASGDPMIKLANALDWNALAEIALPDLKQTAKGFLAPGPQALLAHAFIGHGTPVVAESRPTAASK